MARERSQPPRHVGAARHCPKPERRLGIVPIASVTADLSHAPVEGEDHERDVLVKRYAVGGARTPSCILVASRGSMIVA